MSAVNSNLLLVGSRTTSQRSGHGTGISVFAHRDGAWSQDQQFTATNPSHLLYDPAHKMVHALHGDGTTITTLSVTFAAPHPLVAVGSQSTGGANPVHATISPDRRFVLVANHNSGDVVSLPILDDGSLGPVCSKLSLTGEPGPHRTEQTGAKPHQIVFSPFGEFLLIPDKGVDTIYVAKIDSHGDLALHSSRRLRGGSGPRHLSFHPGLPVCYTIDEVSSTITTLSWTAESGTLQPQQIVTSTAPTDVHDSRGAEIVVHPNGRFVFASNRRGNGDSTPGGPGNDTIVVYAVDATNGTLVDPRWFSSHGKRPRFLLLTHDASRLLVANERSHSIVEFDVDPNSGSLEPSGQSIATGSPTWVLQLEN